MALGKGIPVINGFDLNSKLPLDSRTVADTMENMNKLVTDGSVGDGQLCYCKADKKLYVLKEGVWTEVGGGSGKGLNILSLNLKDCMNESDYNELVGYILQKTITAKAYNITLPDLTDVDIVKFTIESPIGNISTRFYRNSKAITQFNWLCNWTDNENFMQMVTISGFTDNNVNYIKYNGIDGSGGGGGSGMQIVDCTLTDQTDITKGGTIDNIPEAPFLLRIPLNLQDEGSYGKHLLDNILIPMNYTYGKFKQGGEGQVVPDRYFGAGFALSAYYYASVDISTKKVSITSQVNASYAMLPVDLPTESQPTVTISDPKQDIIMQTMLVGNDFYFNGVVLYGYLFSWTSPVYTKDVTVNNTTYYTMFYYTAEYDDINNNLTIRYHEIPITTTITFEN